MPTIVRSRKPRMHFMDSEGDQLLQVPHIESISGGLKVVDLDAEDEKPFPSPKSYMLHAYDELPAWMKDNHFIRTGYRVQFSVALCFKSLFKLHNETWSIWTHLIGFLSIFVLSFFMFGWFIPKGYSGTDVFIISVFLIGAQCQMLFSTVFHMFGCHSPRVYSWLAKLDYSGISLMIVGSYYPPMYYGFYCHPTWQAIYLIFITLFGVAGIVVGAIPIFATPRYRVTRAAFFLVFGFSAIVPLPHMIYNEGAILLPLLLKEALLGALYVGGVLFYTSRFPEKCMPGSCDTGFASHVIWHLFTMAAAYLQLAVCVECYNFRLTHPCA